MVKNILNEFHETNTPVRHIYHFDSFESNGLLEIAVVTYFMGELFQGDENFCSFSGL
jgi:hypothetical protein